MWNCPRFTWEISKISKMRGNLSEIGLPNVWLLALISKAWNKFIALLRLRICWVYLRKRNESVYFLTYNLVTAHFWIFHSRILKKKIKSQTWEVLASILQGRNVIFWNIIWARYSVIMDLLLRILAMCKW